MFVQSNYKIGDLVSDADFPIVAIVGLIVSRVYIVKQEKRVQVFDLRANKVYILFEVNLRLISSYES